jgi:hypothetical protein
MEEIMDEEVEMATAISAQEAEEQEAASHTENGDIHSKLRASDAQLARNGGTHPHNAMNAKSPGLNSNDNMANQSIGAPVPGQIRTLDGEIVEDEFDADALNYQILLRKIDDLLERLKLDA